MDFLLSYKGTRWFKCDLHLHTTASKCFQDKEVTPEQWVARAIEQGLNCVAVTDHNTGHAIDSIKLAAAGTELVVFPGVEITCDTSKIHLLILFDVTKTTNDINDFLILCGIKREDFADQEAHTTNSIFSVAEIANKAGALIIPAHIDEYNGLGTVSTSNLESFYGLDYINAVQVVHKDFLSPTLNVIGNLELKRLMNEYYNNPSTVIDDATLKSWYTPVKNAKTSNLAILTFSDNPHAPKNSKHGLDGIGSRYSWIKMNEIPSLESLRHAFLLPNFRIKSDFDSPEKPYKMPELWIKSVSVTNSIITGPTNTLRIDFSPQLTTIIGGRGSGKSSILRFVRGLFNRTIDLTNLTEIIADHNHFYRLFDQKTQKGVLNVDTIVQIEFVRNGVLHKIAASDITNSNNQTIVIQKFDANTKIWTLEEAIGYIDFFEYEQYSQKQIYEIAQEPNSLRERIDRSISEMDSLKSYKEIIKKTFLEKSASIRTIRQQIVGKGKLQTEINDLNERIRLLQQSGIATLLTSKEKFTLQGEIIKTFIKDVQIKETGIGALVDSIQLLDLDYSNFSDTQSLELKPYLKGIVEGYIVLKGELELIKLKAKGLREALEASILQTNWSKELIVNATEFEAKKTELESQGIDDISNFEKLSQAKFQKENELEKIVSIEASLINELSEREALRNNYLEKIKAITLARTNYVKGLLQDDKVKVSILPFRNRADFINKIRGIIQRPNGFDNDIDVLAEMCFIGNAEQKIKDVKGVFLKIRVDEQILGISGYFVNLIQAMSDAQIDEIELLWPEDEIDIKYKPSGVTTFRPLSTASAGQKTTAILTFILSQGNIPLLLDQPEDDLDNRLVYELIVDRLKQAKEYRQIIVVTHNANIPVNGDAEYILSMDSESKLLSVLYSGTVEQQMIKKEICDVMEGTEEAFDMRSKRYKTIN